MQPLFFDVGNGKNALVCVVWRCSALCSSLAFRHLLEELQRDQPFFTLLTTNRPGQKSSFYKCVKGKNMQSRPAKSKSKKFGAYSKKEYHFGIWIEQLQAKCQAFTQKRQYLLGFVPKKF